MLKLFYVTGNKHKFESAKRHARKFGIDFIQKKLDIKEIQSDSIEEIVKEKAKQAFKVLKKPLVVSDSGWSIPALEGFPGPYMHYINQWFGTDDFLRLMNGKKDKSIILEYIICVISSKGSGLFKKSVRGRFTNYPKGRGVPSDRIVVLGKNRHTIAENVNCGQESTDDSDLWKKVGQWFEKVA